MSSLLSTARARSLRPAPLPRPRLTIVPKVAARTPRIPFVLLVVTVLGLGLVGLLLLNTGLQRGAYEVTDLRQTSADLTLRQQNLRVQVADLQQPQQLAERALRLGMVRNDSPAFLSIATGKIVGAAVPGVAINKVDLGTSAVTSDPSAGKVPPEVAGEHLSGVGGIVQHKPDRPRPNDRVPAGDNKPAEKSTKAPDTAGTSQPQP